MRESAPLKLRTLRFPAFAIVLLSAAGCYVSSQAPSETFVDGKIPPGLDAVANPAPRASGLPQDEASTVTVAVVDNGTDYLHPFLANRMRYQKKDGKIVGAGWDFFGEDAWPHPNLIEASTFAFGAQIVEGKIANPLADPLAKLDELNNDFMTELTKKTRSRGDLFNKINVNSFHLMGAKALLVQKIALLRRHEELKRNGVTLLKPKSNAQKVTAILEGVVRLVLEGPWLLDGSSGGLPGGLAIEMLLKMDGFDDFLNDVDKVYREFDVRTKFEEKYFAPYAAYRGAELDSSERGNSSDDRVKNFASELYDRWFKLHFNFIAQDPAWRASQLLCRLIDDADYRKLRSSRTSDAEKRELIFSRLEQVYGDVEKVANYHLKSADHTATQKVFTTQPMLDALPRYKAWVYKVLADRGPDLLYCDPERLLKRDYPDARKYLDFARRSDHPYLFSKSSTEIHGSHVAGIVLSQEPGARVLPIRVITESRQTTAAFDLKTERDFLREFGQWVQSPMVREAVLSKIGPYLGSKDIMAEVSRMLPAVYESNKLMFLFFVQIRDSIRYVGEKKVKIVNMSLGDEFKQPVAGTAVGKAAEFRDALLHIFYEYFKFSIAQSIRDHARGTLFVVASGNSGAALNSITNSGLPCDLSSPFFIPFEKKHGQKAPNNQIDNILCVGSLNPNQDLSSFTNVVLSTAVPFVFSYGEAIESSIHSENCGGVDDTVARTIGPDPSISATDADVEELLWSRDSPQRNGRKVAKDLEDFAKMKERLNAEAMLVVQLSSLAKTQACLTDGYIPHKKLSGTSMASPAVAGQFARLVLSKLKEAGLTEEAAYEDYRFNPPDLIRELTETAPALGDRSRIHDVKKLIQNASYAGSLSTVELGGNGSTVPSLVLQPRP